MSIFSFSALFFFLLLFPVLLGDDCMPMRCNKKGPKIQFPFRHKYLQPQHCGYSSSPGDAIYVDGFTLNWSKPACGFCESQEKLCRLAANYTILCIDKPETTKQGRSNTPLIAGATLGSVLLVLILAALYRFYSSIRSEKHNQVVIENFLEDYKALKPTRFSYADIKKITSEFSEKLGEGGYGMVYKGKMTKEIPVAVKVLNHSQGNGEEFINEVGTIGKIHHVNIVRLVGFCADGFKRALVYEFLPNDTLEKFIFSERHKKDCIHLLNIALGTAKGIEYLHQGCDKQILHFDIKPNNIMLDHNFNPKICDFGLAKLCSKEQSAVSMTAARGTMGYIAPEVLSRTFGRVSHKSDVYSFGMLLLEMVGGRKNVDVTVNHSQVYFPKWIYNQLNRGEETVVQVDEGNESAIVKKLTVVGLWCIQWYPADRPSIKVVVQMLEGDVDGLVMPPDPFPATNVIESTPRVPRRRYQTGLELIAELE